MWKVIHIEMPVALEKPLIAKSCQRFFLYLFLLLPNPSDLRQLLDYIANNDVRAIIELRRNSVS